MTDDDKALVERLRSLGPIQASSLFTVTIDRAADRIEAQAAEIAELKSWKAAEDAHHHKLWAEIQRLKEGLLAICQDTTDSFVHDYAAELLEDD